MAEVVHDVKTYQFVDRIMSAFRVAVREAQEESRRLGVPNVYSFNGRIYYELPNGDIVRELPKEFEFPPLPRNSVKPTDVTSTPEA